jgi:hypothetical protein
MLSLCLQVVGFVIAVSAVIYSTFSAGLSSKDIWGGKEGFDSNELPYRADWFHLIFALASMYIGMLVGLLHAYICRDVNTSKFFAFLVQFSNWEVSPSTTTFEIDQGWISTWVKMGSQWASAALYIWSVIAPAVLPNRDFGYV